MGRLLSGFAERLARDGHVRSDVALVAELERESAAELVAIDGAIDHCDRTVTEIRQARRKRKREAKVVSQEFKFTIGDVAEAVEVGGKWQATVGKDVKVTAATSEKALNKAMAEYMRRAADRIEKSGRLNG